MALVSAYGLEFGFGPEAQGPPTLNFVLYVPTISGTCGGWVHRPSYKSTSRSSPGLLPSPVEMGTVLLSLDPCWCGTRDSEKGLIVILNMRPHKKDVLSTEREV